MAANIGFNYLPTTNAAGTFNAQSVGYVQGQFIDDPAIRYQLAGGVLATTETLPMWGGVGISETVTPNGVGGPDGALGGLITRADDLAALTGFSVFNQAYGMAITPQSPVPMAPSGGQVNFFRLGSGARIVVQADPTLVDLETGLITQQVSWDFTNQKLIAFNATPGALPVKVLSIESGNSMIVAYSSGTNTATWTYNGTVAVLII